jgi:hypothetical protein
MTCPALIRCAGKTIAFAGADPQGLRALGGGDEPGLVAGADDEIGGFAEDVDELVQVWKRGGA